MPSEQHSPVEAVHAPAPVGRVGGLMAKVARGVYGVIRNSTWTIKLQLCRLMYPGLSTGKGCVLDHGVRISATDGGSITLGDNVYIGRFSTIVAQGHLVIESNSHIGMGASICCKQSITIGESALIAERVTIRDQDHATDSVPYREAGFVSESVSIGRNVWLGAGTTVLKGVRIGENAIVGAGAVVTRNLPDGTVAVGVPARVISAPHQGRKATLEQERASAL